MLEENSMLNNMKLTDIEILPDFEQFPAGAHRVVVEFSTKADSGKNIFILGMTLVEHVELEDESKAIKPLSKGSIMYSLDNEYGRSEFGKLAMRLAEQLGLDAANTSFSDVFNQVEGNTVVVVTKTTTSKQDKSKTFTKLLDIMLE